jgi:V-type H+-transporting ATPase subunit C
MHLKVIRTYIDGVLRFGIPPRFFMSIIKPAKGTEKKLLALLSENFAEASMKDMYGSKEETNDTEDFYPFVFV